MTSGQAMTPVWAYLGRGAYLASLVLLVTPVPSLGQGFSHDGVLLAGRMAFFVALAVSACVLAGLWRRLVPMRAHRRTLVTLTCLRVAVGLCYPLVVNGLLPQGALAVDLVVQALMLPFFELAWGEAFSRFPTPALTRYAAGSATVCALFVALIQSIPGPASHVLSTLLALSTIPLCWMLCADEGQPVRPAPAPGGGAPAARGSGAAVRVLSPSFLVGTVCVLAAGNILAGSTETGSFVTWRSVIIGQFVAAAFLWVVALCARWRTVNLLAFDLCAIGISVVCYLFAGFFSGGHGAVGVVETTQHVLTIAMEQCVWSCTWLLAITRTQELRQPLFPTFAVGVAVIYAGQSLGSILGMVMPLDPASLSLLALALFVPAAFLLALNLRASGATTSATPTTTPSPVGERGRNLDAIADRYGLSPREREVFALWVSGYNLPYVAEALAISKNTAKTHVGHIYRKTSTSTREELLRLVDQESQPAL